MFFKTDLRIQILSILANIIVHKNNKNQKAKEIIIFFEDFSDFHGLSRISKMNQNE
jgi:hypothetical protein